MPMRADKRATPLITCLDHVQLAMPTGGEAAARRFYADVLGLHEMRKPEGLAGRGGCWFASADASVAVHLGVEDQFRPALKAHPAFVVADMDELRERLIDAGAEIVEDKTIDVRRFYTADPFGNRIEVVDEVDRGFTGRPGRGQWQPARVSG